MIIDNIGNLLDSDCTVIMHQCNCFSTMGAGLAKQIARKYPQALIADKKLPVTPEQKLGNFSYAIVGKTTIVNLYGQYRYGRDKRHTDYKAFESALSGFLKHAKLDKRIDLSKVGMPYKIGCGLAGGDWRTIVNIVNRISKSTGVDINFYRLT